ncbi:transposase [Streptomyces sp. TP-A0875]|uniref:transposase n=1 Tax=unclassified Streptomyces TaxID=2593676 RepID=UPI00352B8E11
MPLTDAQWARIEPLLPDRTLKRGGRWRDHREVLDAIACRFRTVTQWVHPPERYGNWRGLYNRLRMWAVDGSWERVFPALVAQADADEELGWAVSVDSTIVRPSSTRPGPAKKALFGRRRRAGGRARRWSRPAHQPVDVPGRVRLRLGGPEHSLEGAVQGPPAEAGVQRGPRARTARARSRPAR